MSQDIVERVIGRLATDEGFRRLFAESPPAALAVIAGGGAALTPCEMRALSRLDPRRIEIFAEAIDPRLQKIHFEEERS